MRTLGLHAATSLADLLYALVPLLPDPEAVRVVAFHYSVVVAFWVPLAVVKANFKQLDGMADTFCRLVC